MMTNWTVVIENLDDLTGAEYERLQEVAEACLSIPYFSSKEPYPLEYIEQQRNCQAFFGNKCQDQATIVYKNPTGQAKFYDALVAEFPQLSFYEETDNGPAFHPERDTGGPRSRLSNHQNLPLSHRNHKAE